MILHDAAKSLSHVRQAPADATIVSASPSRIKNSRLSTAPLPSGSKTHHTASTICRMFRSEGHVRAEPEGFDEGADNLLFLQLTAAVLVPVLEPLVGGARYGRRWRPLAIFPSLGSVS